MEEAPIDVVIPVDNEKSLRLELWGIARRD
jgi:hypothetical protein